MTQVRLFVLLFLALVSSPSYAANVTRYIVDTTSVPVGSPAWGGIPTGGEYYPGGLGTHGRIIPSQGYNFSGCIAEWNAATNSYKPCASPSIFQNGWPGQYTENGIVKTQYSSYGYRFTASACNNQLWTTATDLVNCFKVNPVVYTAYGFFPSNSGVGQSYTYQNSRVWTNVKFVHTFTYSSISISGKTYVRESIRQTFDCSAVSPPAAGGYPSCNGGWVLGVFYIGEIKTTTDPIPSRCIDLQGQAYQEKLEMKIPVSWAVDTRFHVHDPDPANPDCELRVKRAFPTTNGDGSQNTFDCLPNFGIESTFKTCIISTTGRLWPEAKAQDNLEELELIAAQQAMPDEYSVYVKVTKTLVPNEPLQETLTPTQYQEKYNNQKSDPVVPQKADCKSNFGAVCNQVAKQISVKVLFGPSDLKCLANAIYSPGNYYGDGTCLGAFDRDNPNAPKVDNVAYSWGGTPATSKTITDPLKQLTVTIKDPVDNKWKNVPLGDAINKGTNPQLPPGFPYKIPGTTGGGNGTSPCTDADKDGKCDDSGEVISPVPCDTNGDGKCDGNDYAGGDGTMWGGKKGPGGEKKTFLTAYQKFREGVVEADFVKSLDDYKMNIPHVSGDMVFVFETPPLIGGNVEVRIPEKVFDIWATMNLLGALWVAVLLVF